MIGTVISSIDGPNPDSFSFVIKENKGIPVRKDQFVTVETEEGLLVARVVNIRKTNRYFMSAESVRDYSSKASMNSIFPIDEWEFLVADAISLGVLSSNMRRTTFPPSPGSPVKVIDSQVLSKFLGFSSGGINLGEVEHHDLKADINITKLFQKHLAILAMSGAGKSNLASVMLEELVQRKKGKLGILVVDPHGEYIGLSELGAKIIDGHKVSIPVKELSVHQIAALIPISAPQRRDLYRIVKRLRSSHKNYDIGTLISEIDSDEKMKENSKTALIGWLSELDATGFFNGYSYPDPNKMTPGETWVLDLSKVSGIKNQQIIVSYLTRKLFYLRKRGRIPPYVQIVEEAHNFVPEGVRREFALSKGILETVAREGRKFHASICLISQRPIRLSSTILSQCNTHIILRVTNPYDLKHLGETSEGITSETLKSITTLQVGQALVVGEAVNYPVFVKVKLRKTKSPHEKTLEEAALEFEENGAQLDKDSAAFM
jgi:DNA helicase HerA-like ATPase